MRRSRQCLLRPASLPTTTDGALCGQPGRHHAAQAGDGPWHGSREAARVVHDALPLLYLAEEAIVLVVDARDLGAQLG